MCLSFAAPIQNPKTSNSWLQYSVGRFEIRQFQIQIHLRPDKTVTADWNIPLTDLKYTNLKSATQFSKKKWSSTITQRQIISKLSTWKSPSHIYGGRNRYSYWKIVLIGSEKNLGATIKDSVVATLSYSLRLNGATSFRVAAAECRPTRGVSSPLLSRGGNPVNETSPSSALTLIFLNNGKRHWEPSKVPRDWKKTQSIPDTRIEIRKFRLRKN